MTTAIKSLISAIRDLENTCYQFTEVMKEIRPLDETEETALYVHIIGDTWQNYLKAGGSRTMINTQLPRHLEFNGKGQLN